MNRRESLTLLAGTALAGSTYVFGRGTAFAQTPPAAPAPSGPFKLPPLGYDFGALEPHIDAQTMMIQDRKSVV